MFRLKNYIILFVISVFILLVAWKTPIKIDDVVGLRGLLNSKMPSSAVGDSINAHGNDSTAVLQAMARDTSESAWRDSAHVVGMHNLDTTGTKLFITGQSNVDTSIFYDYSGLENNGTNVGAILLAGDSATIGLQAIKFNYTVGVESSYVNIDNIINDLSTTTTGAWKGIITPTIINSVHRIISFGDENADTRLEFYITASGLCLAIARNSGTTQWVVDTDVAVFTVGVKTHIELVHDGVQATIYVNGDSVAQTFSNTTNKTFWFSQMAGLDVGRIGCLNYNNGGNVGFGNYIMDEIKIDSRINSKLEILADYRNPIANNLLLTKTDKNADETIKGDWTFGNVTIDTLTVGDIEESFVFFSMDDTLPTTIGTIGKYEQFAGTFLMADSNNFRFNNMNMGIVYTGTLNRTAFVHFDISTNTDIMERLL